MKLPGYLRVIPFLLLVLSYGCTKDETTPEEEEEPAPAPVYRGSFQYSVNGNTTIKADSTIYYPKFTTIYSYKTGTVNTIEINLADLSSGTYSISSVVGNALTYVSGGQTFTASSGYVNLTMNANSTVSGDFNCGFNGGVISSISGEFKDVKHR